MAFSNKTSDGGRRIGLWNRQSQVMVRLVLEGGAAHSWSIL